MMIVLGDTIIPMHDREEAVKCSTTILAMVLGGRAGQT
jgi:hypothetical protein